MWGKNKSKDVNGDLVIKYGSHKEYCHSYMMGGIADDNCICGWTKLQKKLLNGRDWCHSCHGDCVDLNRDPCSTCKGWGISN